MIIDERIPAAVPDALERPSWACLLQRTPEEGRSWHKADDGFKTCSLCYDRMRERLKDVGRRYLLLNPRPTASGEGGRGAPGFGSRAPASDHIIVMRDWSSKAYEVAVDGVEYLWDSDADGGEGAYTERREVWRGRDGRGHQESPKPPRSVSKTLASIADLIADERGMTQPQTRDVHDLIRWIDGQMDWLTRQEMVTDVYDDLGALVAQMRPVTGDPGRKRVGECPNQIGEGDKVRECKTPLFAPLKGDVIACANPACKRKWYRPDWEQLGRLLQTKTMRPAS